MLNDFIFITIGIAVSIFWQVRKLKQEILHNLTSSTADRWYDQAFHPVSDSESALLAWPLTCHGCRPDPCDLESRSSVGRGGSRGQGTIELAEAGVGRRCWSGEWARQGISQWPYFDSLKKMFS